MSHAQHAPTLTPEAPIALFGERAETSLRDSLPGMAHADEVSGDNAFVDSLRNLPMPEIGPMPPVRFAPIPVMSGVSLTDPDGDKIVNKVEVTITCEDGTTRTIALDERNGGWWVPTDRLDG
jgi:hypothetical protein